MLPAVEGLVDWTVEEFAVVLVAGQPGDVLGGQAGKFWCVAWLTIETVFLAAP